MPKELIASPQNTRCAARTSASRESDIGVDHEESIENLSYLSCFGLSRPSTTQGNIDRKGKIGAANYLLHGEKLIIQSHGAPFLTMTTLLVSGSVLGLQVRQLVNSLKSSGHSVSSISLRSCFSAAGGPASQAQCLANATGLSVTGYLTRFSSKETIDPYISLGKPKYFEPQTSSGNVLAQTGNSLAYVPLVLAVAVKTPYNLIAKAVRGTTR